LAVGNNFADDAAITRSAHPASLEVVPFLSIPQQLDSLKYGARRLNLICLQQKSGIRP
jgi:hypothetical protein